MTGYPEMLVLNTSVFKTTALKGYGFNLVEVYIIWVTIIFFLYPFCKWFGQNKKANQSKYWWLSYL
jgi:hypothetical protein